MASQAGQDAKFFQRGKIQVRRPTLSHRRVLRHDSYPYVFVLCGIGVPLRAAGSRVQGQEVRQAQDGAEEDRGEYYHGERQSVRFVRLSVLAE